jgi:hypothetical protein
MGFRAGQGAVGAAPKATAFNRRVTDLAGFGNVFTNICTVPFVSSGGDVRMWAACNWVGLIFGTWVQAEARVQLDGVTWQVAGSASYIFAEFGYVSMIAQASPVVAGAHIATFDIRTTVLAWTGSILAATAPTQYGASLAIQEL